MEEKNLNEIENVEETQVESTEVEEVKEEEYTGPKVLTQVRYDYRTMKAFNMYNMVYKRHFSIIYIVMGILALAFGVYQLVTGLMSDEQINGLSLILPIVFVLFGVYFLYQAFFFENIIDKNISMHFAKNPRVVKMNVEITEEKVSIILPRDTEPFRYPWAYVTEIVETNEYFFLYVQKQPIIIEKDSNKVIEGSYETLLKIIEDQKVGKPFKKVEKQLYKKPVTYVHLEDSEFEEVDNEVESEVTENQEENNNEE